MIDDLILCERIIEKAPISNRYKTAVIGYFFEGKTYEEVGSDLGCGKQRASQIIQEALRRIKRKFNPAPVTYKWLKPIPKKPKEERISKDEYYRLLALEVSHD
jgi:hypothetical protein